MTEQSDKKNTVTYFCAAGIALLFFLFLYGPNVINPQQTDWIMTSETDLPQHYLGWRGFRASTWRFPIGMTDTLSYSHSDTGRFAWIVVYILMVEGIAGVIRWKDRRRIAVLCLLVIIQIVDMKDYMTTIRRKFHVEVLYVSRLKDPIWKELGSDSKYLHMHIISPSDVGEMYDFAYYALSNQMTLNRFVFARETGGGRDTTGEYHGIPG